MICFNHKGMHRAEALDDHFRRVTKISDEAKAGRAAMKGEANRIDRIVRHREGLNYNIDNGKFGTGSKDSPISMFPERAVAPNRLSGQSIRINRDIEFATQNLKTADVIAVLVSKQNAVELFGRDSALFEAQDNLPRTQATIDQNFAVICRNQGAVPGAAASEHRQTEHAVFSDYDSVFAN